LIFDIGIGFLDLPNWTQAALAESNRKTAFLRLCTVM
jgi:hypothetical protein